MLKIRDETVRTLAQEVMRLRGAPNMTAAIKLSLQNCLKDLDRAALVNTAKSDQSANNS
jgi:antitoxin VapB